MIRMPNSWQILLKLKNVPVRPKTVVNSSQRSRYRTLIKTVRAALSSGDKAAAQEAFAKCEPVLDRYASRGLVHKNFVSRTKSRLRAAIKALG